MRMGIAHSFPASQDGFKGGFQQEASVAPEHTGAGPPGLAPPHVSARRGSWRSVQPAHPGHLHHPAPRTWAVHHLLWLKGRPLPVCAPSFAPGGVDRHRHGGALSTTPDAHLHQEVGVRGLFDQNGRELRAAAAGTRQGSPPEARQSVAWTSTMDPSGAYGTVLPSIAAPSTTSVARAPGAPELVTVIR